MISRKSIFIAGFFVLVITSLLLLSAPVFGKIALPFVTLSIADWYPQDRDYVFECNAYGFEPTSYSYWFGDGEKLLNIKNDNVFHRYAENGEYKVRCLARNDRLSLYDSMKVIVNVTEENPTAEVSVHPVFPADQVYVFECNSNFVADTWQWDFGDGTQTTREGNRTYYFGGNPYGPDNVQNKDVFHVFPHGGEFKVTCTASNDNGEKASNSLQVDVEYQSGGIITDDLLRDSTYGMSCDPVGFEQSRTVWLMYRNGQGIYNNAPGGNAGDAITYTFSEVGNYDIECRPYTSDDRYRWDYWEGDSSGYTPCNDPYGCVEGLASTQIEVNKVFPLSEMFLVSGILNNQEVTPDNREIIVSPGEQITGTINTYYSSDEYGGGSGGTFVMTANWGDHSSQYGSAGNFFPPANGEREFSINYVAPQNPGEYFIIFAFDRQTTSGLVASMTHWTYGSRVWNDGNDIAEWSLEMIEHANEYGNVLGSILYGDDEYYDSWLGATAVKVIVAE